MKQSTLHCQAGTRSRRPAGLCVLLCAAVLLLFGQLAQAATYYSQGSLDATSPANWNANPGGGGTAPANFTTAGDVFIVQGGHSMTTSQAWTMGANTLEIANGGTLTATS